MSLPLSKIIQSALRNLCFNFGRKEFFAGYILREGNIVKGI